MRLSNFSKMAQVEAVLGPIVFKAVQNLLKADSGLGRKMKRCPWSINFHKTKPQFHLHDFETMKAYGINLATGEITGQRYCGSGQSTINHLGEQLAQGETVPDGFALIFITNTYGGSGNTPWTLDIVTQNITPQLESVEALKLKVG